jgi:hypothetical protein
MMAGKGMQSGYRTARGKVKDLVLRLPERYQPARLRQRQNWAIAILEGPSPLSLQHSSANPVLTKRDVTDVPADFVADPFMIRRPEGWHLFFEVFNRATVLGEIGLATSTDLRTWRYERVVLREDFHLSYPCVFEEQGEIYMIPETSMIQAVRLYKAVEFPSRWEPVADLLEGLPFRDATPFRHAGRWWLYTETGAHWSEGTLRLYGAEELTGPWEEHPNSPLVIHDPSRARPAGPPILLSDGSFLRLAQDCSSVYGGEVRAFRVTRLTADRYVEEAVEGRLVGASGRGWNAHGMHHVDAHQMESGDWVACVDGH